MKRIVLITVIVIGFSLASCKALNKSEKATGTNNIRVVEEKNAKKKKKADPIDYKKVKPDESGKIMIVMFHNFVENFSPKNGDNGEYTTTFDEFEKLLPVLYQKGYRLISMGDYLDGNVDVSAGCIPIVFTFDDATSGQFNLKNENGKLVVNEKSAVGIMRKFNEKHPDFGMKGTFYINSGIGTFEGDGSLGERLKYLVDMGFDIGNHTYTHVNLSKIDSAQRIIQEVGENQKKVQELVPNYKLKTFSLPYGAPPDDLKQHVIKGEYNGVEYENFGIVEVGWDPALSAVDKKFDPFSVHRVRASGIKPVDSDFGWWLNKLPREEQYISDGDVDTVTVPSSRIDNVDKSKLKGKKIVSY